jgi:hypothetical protein
MKNWTEHVARAGNAISPAVVNAEISAGVASIQTLDRTQLPDNSIGVSRLTDYAMHRVWCTTILGSTGEQTAAVDTSIKNNMWRALSYQSYGGGWLTAHTLTLTGCKNGDVFIEWSGNGYVFPGFTNTSSNFQPGNPKYLGVRMIVAGVVVAERKGCAYHEHWRIFGNIQLPQGDHSVSLQFQAVPPGKDDAIETAANDHITQAHLYSSKVFAIGRWR